MSKTLEKALEALDKQLLKWATEGVTDTNPITGDEQVRELGDKEAKVILARCKMAGVGVIVDEVTAPGGLVNPMAKVMERMQEQAKAGGARFKGLTIAQPSRDELEREVG